MSTGRIRHSKSQLNSIDFTNAKREMPSHAKKLSFSGHQNVSLAHSASAHGLSSDKSRYRSMNEIETGYRNDGENGENISSNMFGQNKSALQVSHAQEKKIFDQLYKMKTLKFKPYLNECDPKTKKVISELNFVKKPMPKKESKKSENSKNSINFASHNSHRDLLNVSSRKLDQSNNTSQIKESTVVDCDKGKVNKIANIDLQNALLAKLKETPSQIQTSQRNRIKLSEPPYPNKLTQKIQKKNSVSQLRRIGDLEALRLNLKHHIPINHESHDSVEKPSKPVKGHRRGLSMDQAATSLNRSYSHASKQNLQIHPAKAIVKVQNSGNHPNPTQENNPQFQDPKFIEEFFASDQLKFEFERNVISRLNKRKNETNATTLASTMNTRNGMTHSRTRSIEESNLMSLLKSNSRWSSQKISSREDMPIAPGNSYLQETLNDTNRIGNLMESNY